MTVKVWGVPTNRWHEAIKTANMQTFTAIYRTCFSYLPTVFRCVDQQIEILSCPCFADALKSAPLGFMRFYFKSFYNFLSPEQAHVCFR